MKLKKNGFIELIIIAFVFLLVIPFILVYLFVARPYQVRGTAMEPTFHSGAYLLTATTNVVGFPKEGDSIVFKSPISQKTNYIKRIIGVPEDRIRIEKGVVYVNGSERKEPYLSDPKTNLWEDGFMVEGEEVIVPLESYFVMGDNRLYSADSREWGFVPKQNILGKVLFCYWNCK